MMSYEVDQLINTHFPDVCVDKRLSRQIATSRAIPDYVTDWLVHRYTVDGIVDKEKISQFLSTYLPEKRQKQQVLNRLRKGGQLKILDAYSVRVNINTAELVLDIPCLDISNASIHDNIVDLNPLLLDGNVWGSGTLQYYPADDKESHFKILMVDFVPMQTSKVDLQYYIDVRNNFTLEQWRELLVRSMGYNPKIYSPDEQMLLLTRLCPMVQPGVNMIELASKGTGKSYIFSQISKHAWLISGGVVTRAQLFFDMGRKTAGVITRYDVIVLDEVQTIKLDNEGEIVGALKGYLESNEYRVMQYKGSSDAGVVLLANIPLDAFSKPKSTDLMRGLPDWLQGEASSALIDRFHAILPGWEIRKIDKNCLCDGMALRADYFGEIMHEFRKRDEYSQFVKNHTNSTGNLRDIKAVERLAAAFIKLLFPDLSILENNLELFNQYCLTPAKSLRKRVREQLAISDQEFNPDLASIEAQL